MKGPALAAALLLACSVVAAPCRAGEVAAAESLFLEGRTLLDRGEVDAACLKFAESQRLEPSSGTLLNLAACHERQGHLATAWAEYRGAEHLAVQQGKDVRITEARRKIADLEPRLSFLTIHVESAVDGLEIKRDATRLDVGALESPIPTDPGPHRVTATAPGHEPFAADITIGEAGDRQTITVPALRALPPEEAPKPAPVMVDAPRSLPPRDPTLGLVVGVSGLAVAGAGGLFFILSLSADANAKSGCAVALRYRCTPDALDDERRRDTFATIATVGGIVGAVGIGAGAFLLFGPRLDSPKTGVTAARVGPGSLVVEGAF